MGVVSKAPSNLPPSQHAARCRDQEELALCTAHSESEDPVLPYTAHVVAWLKGPRAPGSCYPMPGYHPRRSVESAQVWEFGACSAIS